MKIVEVIGKCRYCGKEFAQVRSSHVYCCSLCKDRARSGKAPEELPPEMICRFNNGVMCNPNGRTCQKCGWDPKVAAARLRRIRKELMLYDCI